MTTAAHSSKRLGAGSPSRSISTEIAHCLSAGRRHFKTYSDDLPRSRPFGDRLVLNLATVQDFERQSVEAVALRRRKNSPGYASPDAQGVSRRSDSFPSRTTRSRRMGSSDQV